MPNEDIRNLIRKTRVHQYEISDRMQISEGRFSTLLRKELPDEKKKEIKAIIKELTGQETCGMQMEESEKAIDGISPADVRENVHGKWVSHKLENGNMSIDKDSCSICGTVFEEIARTGGENYNFCPNCGADLRKKGETP